jgi:hypothetical protein
MQGFAELSHCGYRRGHAETGISREFATRLYSSTRNSGFGYRTGFIAALSTFPE